MRKLRTVARHAVCVVVRDGPAPTLSLRGDAMKHSIREHMWADHSRMMGLFQKLTDTVDGADAPTIERMWTEFERVLETHMQAEERHLFPLLEETDPTEVRELWAEHQAFRRLVAELGVRTDLHTLRKETVDDLVEKLRAHANRENELLYRRADELMAPAARREALEWLEEERQLPLGAAAGSGPARARAR